jgi:glycosyltransferase involved in cell wall biosynthesis
VLCAYTDERWDDIVAAVGSVRRQTLAPREVILVVDHNEALLGRARALEGVTVLASKRAPGASGARNTGVEASSGSVIAFLDDDAQADSRWLESLLGRFASENVAGVGGPIEPVWPGDAPAWFPPEFNWVVGCTYLGARETAGPVRNLIGANMSVRRRVWEQVGGFRDGFGVVKSAEVQRRSGESRQSTCEETEFCLRVTRECPGLEWFYEPLARVRHLVPPHRCTWRYFMSRSRAEGVGKAGLAASYGEGSLGVEASYAGRTLMAGVVRGCREALLGGDLDGLRRSGAIMAGVSMAGSGYLQERAASLRGRSFRA